jgi:RNA polymerase sigma-70 factor (ECF subfamily)
MRKRSNEEWQVELRSPGPARDAALVDLHALLLSGLPYALSKWLSRDDPRLAPLVEETAQDTLLRILSRLDTFENRSQFTTWVYTIAVRVALTELRRKRWENISLEGIADGEYEPRDRKTLPERHSERADLKARLVRMVAEELTARQRQGFEAMVLQRLPLEEIARRLNTNRNALYKLLHDARLRIRRRLESEGLSAVEVLEIFDNE